MSGFPAPDSRPCPDCGSKRVWAETISDHISVQSKRASILARGEYLRPLVCTGCGLTLLYHPKPELADHR